MQQFDQYVKLNKKIPPEILTSISGIDDPGRLADTIAAHLPLKLEAKQSVLDLFRWPSGLEKLLELLEHEVDILQVEKRIRGRVKRQMEKSQREYYLNEQVKAIQKELGDGEEGADLEELEKKIKAARKMPKEARKKAEGELKKLKLMSPMSAEATVVRNYIDSAGQPALEQEDQDQARPGQCREVLNEDHYGLDKVKDRILEYLAVQQRVDKVKAPILCLVGPPGVGKTSLGQSVAQGHRPQVRAHGAGRHARRGRDPRPPPHLHRLHAGQGAAEPDQGRRAQPAVPARRDRQAGHGLPRRPVFSALLEVLDPEQNHTFSDHYVEVDFDLSDVMFVATSNSMNIPPALLDRMEVIRLSGYTEDEKLNIASATCCPSSRRTTASRTARWRSPSRPCAASSATTRVRPVCARWSARSPRSAARWSRACSSRPTKARWWSRGQPQRLPGRAQVRLRPRREEEPGRPGGGSGLDRGGRRPADHRGGGDARQGQHHPHRARWAT
jgi:ATP-dependent Lon protease